MIHHTAGLHPQSPRHFDGNVQRESPKPDGPSTSVTSLQLLRKQKAGRDSSVGVATRYGLDGRGIESR